ncbi:Gfo/Idh/MocA family protein [Arachidicoccus terrestris]|uniref:Gfo/Idh/MocA family protein n=1 Tax=Arachidicoccus terrestris TaxID=2875539 RepID=UPI001CC5297D|nr:Gfo/Idh/MocA family oxidoreductase [Arachidicoccus terrestris]UAY54347.1 Gfo/Idh/MocA family oxidoreductase [Arachidicoccus terrestris]
MKLSLLLRTALLSFAAFLGFSLSASGRQAPLKVALAGLSHDHVYLLMQHYKKGEVAIVGIVESDPVLVEKFKKTYHLADTLFYKDLSVLLRNRKPEVVMAFGPNVAHLSVVEACAPLHVNVMVEKPLATTVKDAERIVSLAKQHHIYVLTDYETSWYASNQAVYKQVSANEIGEVRKMVAHDGHQGPKEIGCSPQFLSWLTDPKKNGAGALFDFGCYGANLMTWLMNGSAPEAVYAVTRQIKPTIYPNVDDDATIVLDYPAATGIIEASWNWPYNIKDWEVFGKNGYLQAVDPDQLRARKNGEMNYTIEKLPAPAQPYRDYVAYVSAVVRGQLDPGNDLSSLQNNLIVVKILAAARQSAREGRKIYLK